MSTAQLTPPSEASLKRQPLCELAESRGSASVLDVCCGGRMFWHNRKDPRAIYADKRQETHDIGQARMVVIAPDVVADFTALPFPNDHFALVVYDPPHIQRLEARGYLTKKYGVLIPGWREMIEAGFAECFRVLRPEGTLIFKWSESEIPSSEIMKLTPEKPLISQRCGKRAQTHWIVYMKPK